MQEPAGAPEEIVVDRRTADLLWPGGDAVGSVLREQDPRAGQQAGYVVVGVAGDVQLPAAANVRLPTVGPPRGSLIYQPRVLPGDISYLVRVTGPPAAMVPALRRAVAAVNPMVLVRRITVGDAFIHDVMAPSEFAMALFGAFAIVALVLSAVGLYGTIAYSVSQRTREIGVRIALGADGAAIRRLVVGDGVRLAIIGAILGLAGSLAASNALHGMLYHVAPSDPATLVGVVGLVVVIALLASYGPARRALRVDPTEALRAE